MLASNPSPQLWRKLLFWVVTLTLLSTCHTTVPPLNISALEAEIHQQTNQLRAEQQLEPLQSLDMLSTIARAHSKDMSERQFFEHINPDGLAPHERLSNGLPEAINMYSGENLAKHSQDNFDTSALAAELMRLWIASPDHLAQLTTPEFRHLGVGVFQDDAGVVYATQTFATLVAQLTEPIPATVSTHTPFRLSFTFLAPFDRQELSAFLHTNHGFARIEGPNGLFYKGKGPVPIQWLDNTHFEVRIPTELGPGRYRVLLGRNGRFFEKDFVIEVS